MPFIYPSSNAASSRGLCIESACLFVLLQHSLQTFFPFKSLIFPRVQTNFCKIFLNLDMSDYFLAVSIFKNIWRDRVQEYYIDTSQLITVDDTWGPFVSVSTSAWPLSSLNRKHPFTWHFFLGVAFSSSSLLSQIGFGCIVNVYDSAFRIWLPVWHRHHLAIISTSNSVF